MSEYKPVHHHPIMPPATSVALRRQGAPPRNIRLSREDALQFQLDYNLRQAQRRQQHDLALLRSSPENVLRLEEIARLERREDSRVQREVLDRQLAGLSPSDRVGGGSVSAAPSPPSEDEDKKLQDILRMLTPLAVIMSRAL